MMTLPRSVMTGAACLLMMTSAGRAQTNTYTTEPLPPEMSSVEFRQQLNNQLPLDLMFRNEEGLQVELGSYFQDDPVILTLVYYECPMLCNLILNGLRDVLRQLAFTMGEEYQVVTVSFDHEETHILAREKKASYLNDLGAKGREDGWHFLVGEEEQIQALCDAAGFEFVYDPRSDEFAHASGIVVNTPDGKISHYFYGIEYPMKDLRLALVEASDGKIGNPVDQLLLFCYHYDPVTGRYGMVINNTLRIACLLTVALLGFALYRLIKSDPNKRKA